MGQDTLTHATTVDLEPARRLSAAAFGARLTVVHPPELRRTVELEGSRLNLGRDPDTLAGRLRHGTVSRRHLSLEWVGAAGVHVAADLESHNGSWLDGRSLGSAPQEVRDGSVLRLGSVVLVYEALREPLSPSSTPGSTRGSSEETIVGDSPAAELLRRQLARMAGDPSPVLVTGETGVGKEHVVRQLHALGGHPGKLVPINVAELSAQLIESQLFGHVQGAFTGAGRAQRGLFREAHEGTLFLDEIGELPADLQPKLLRVIQERKVRAVGGTKEEPVDVRIVAATHRNLGAAVEEGTFRRDLLARLSLLELRVPPLRERRSDVLRWVARLHRRWSEERGRSDEPLSFDSRAVERLLTNDWPENLRGLDRVVHRLALRERAEPVTHHDLDGLLDDPEPAAPAAAPRRPAKRPAPRSAEELRAVLAEHGGSVRATAQWYRRDRRQIYRWMDRFGIDRD